MPGTDTQQVAILIHWIIVLQLCHLYLLFSQQAKILYGHEMETLFPNRKAVHILAFNFLSRNYLSIQRESSCKNIEDAERQVCILEVAEMTLSFKDQTDEK